MELRLPARKPIDNRRSWHGSAFILEALVLLVFVMAFTVILMQLFVGSRTGGNDADLLSSAVVLATNDAESFAAEPDKTVAARYYTADDGTLEETGSPSDETLSVTRAISKEDRAGGTLYRADIAVSQGGEVLYELSTAQYVSDAEVNR